MKYQILAKELQCMASEQILSLVDKKELDEIKKTEEHPTFRAYAIAHEGGASGTIVGVGNVAMQYMRNIISQIHNKLKIGTPFFVHHAKGTNSHAGRTPIGKVVGKALETINGVLHEVAIAHIKPEFVGEPLDVASYEVSNMWIETDEERKRASAVSVGDITGIALGNSQFDTPGFPGATLLATVQAFVEGERNVTIDEIKTAIRTGGYTLSQIFEKEHILADQSVAEYARKEKQTEYEAKRRLQEDLGDKLDKMREERDSFASKIGALEAEATRAKAVSVFDALATERKLTDVQKAYVNKRIEKDFKSSGKDEAAVRKEITDFMQSSLQDLEETSVLLGIKTQDGKTPGVPNTDDVLNEDPSEEVDYTDPKNNPLILQ